MNRKYGWKKDSLDHRDLKYGTHHKVPSNEELPRKVDLRSECSPVFDQGQLSSCTGNALAGALEFLELKELKAKMSKSEAPEEFGDKFSSISRLFVYWNEREMEGDTDEDGGAMIRDGIKTLASIGACEESLWPYLEDNLFKKPLQKAFDEASVHKISKYMQIETLSEMKHCLSEGYPFVFGFTVFDQFEGEQMAKDGILHMPSKHDRPQGGHAVMCCAYDDDRKAFLIRNSWGPNWGIDGYFWMPYDYITNPDLCSDFWTIRK
jgi:C1A family cysteine protease